MAPRRQVAIANFRDNDIHAKYQDEREMFHHAIYLNGSKPFMLREFALTSGPHAGLKAYVAVPANHFPFERLPLELRQRVYKLLFPVKHTVLIEGHKRSARPRKTAILCVNRAINAEAVEFLYRPSHFKSSALTVLNNWLFEIGSCRKHLTRVTITKSAPSLLSSCYGLLSDATSLQYLEMALPSGLRATLGENIDRHWESLKLYLLAPRVNCVESLRRLGTVNLKIRQSQNGILNSEGDPMKEMTKARHDFCKVMIRGKVLEHFKKNAVQPRVAIKAESDSTNKVESIKLEKKDTKNGVIAKAKHASAYQSRPRIPSVVVIDED